MKHVQIFSGSSNPILAAGIAKELKAPNAKVNISRFSNDEARIWIEEKSAPHTAVVVQSLSECVDEHLVEFGLICDAVHRLGATNIIGVIPWLGYSKQDKVFRPGEPLSVKVIAKMLQVVPLKRLYVFDLHNLAILGFFDIPVTNLTANPLFVEYFKSQITPKSVVVAPDAGSIKSSTAFAHEINVPIVYMDKKRDLKSGEVEVFGISRSVSGLDVIIVDDMIVTGSTLVETAKYLKSEKVNSISVAATHHLYVSGATEAIFKAGIDKIIVTDTIAPKEKNKKLIVLSVARIVAQEIAKIGN
jgi:ribose-phosphate pyrophosphokinase